MFSYLMSLCVLSDLDQVLHIGVVKSHFLPQKCRLTEYNNGFDPQDDIIYWKIVQVGYAMKLLKNTKHRVMVTVICLCVCILWI